MKNNSTKNLVYIAAILCFAACKKLSSIPPSDTTSGDIVTVAGNGTSGLGTGYGSATLATINPLSIAVDNGGNIYIAEAYLVRKVKFLRYYQHYRWYEPGRAQHGR